MRLPYVIQSRKLRTWVVLIALVIMMILTAVVFSQSRRSPKPFEMDDLYGLLD
jgi:hypothetical protein